jgi:hypothetical protein
MAAAAPPWQRLGLAAGRCSLCPTPSRRQLCVPRIRRPPVVARPGGRVVTLSRSRRLPGPGPSRLPDRLPDDQPCIDKQTKPKKGGTQVPLVLKCSVASCPLRRVKPNLAVGNPLTKLPLNPDPARVTLPSLKSSVLDHRSDVHQKPTTELQKITDLARNSRSTDPWSPPPANPPRNPCPPELQHKPISRAPQRTAPQP